MTLMLKHKRKGCVITLDNVSKAEVIQGDLFPYPLRLKVTFSNGKYTLYQTYYKYKWCSA